MKMTLDIYSSNKSVKPVFRASSWADLVNFLEENRVIAEACQKIRETGDKSHKNRLPAMMPMGTVGDKTRKKENCVPTGLVMVDIDAPVSASPEGGGEPFGAVVKAFVKEKEGVLRMLGIRLIHITPSGKGLRIILPCLPEGMEATVEKVDRDLALERFGKVDPACKDLSRLSYLVPTDYMLWENGLFDEVPVESVEAMKRLQFTGSFAPKGATLLQVGDIARSDEEWKDFAYNGKPVREIAAEYVEATGGEPEVGMRHTCYNELVTLFRNICDNNPRIVHAVLPKFGNGDDETWRQCEGLCASNRVSQIPAKLYYFLKERGYFAERIYDSTSQQEAEVEPLPPMPKLPPLFRQYVNAAPDDFKVPTVVALLPIVGTLTSHLRAEYFDGTEQSTEFISLLFAPPSSGKSFIKRLSRLLQNLRDRDELANAREELYAQSERKKGANDKGEEQPKVSVRIVKPLISVPELLTKMRNNRGHHMYIEAEELDTFNKGNKSAGGDKSDLWRVTWDNGWYGQYYKSVNTFKGEVQMFMNLLFTGTQDQIDRFFKNVEDGLVTRFSVCPIENQQYAKFVPWKKFSKQDEAQVRNILARLEVKNYKVPLAFDKSELLDVKPEDFDAVVPWQYEFQPLEEADMSFLYEPLLDFLEEERLKAVSEVNPARDVFRRRAAVKGFRLGLLCYGLYKEVGKRERAVITDFVKWFCRADLRNSLLQFGKRYNDLQEVANRERSGIRAESIYHSLPTEFTRADVRLRLQRAFMKSPARKIISIWLTNKLIRKVGVDMYQKTSSDSPS